MVTTDAPKRIKRITMHHANRPPFDAQRAVLDRLQEKDFVSIHDDDQTISVSPAATREDLSEEERNVIYQLLGYEQPEPRLFPHIVRRPGLRGGRAVIAGTRIPVWQLVVASREGASASEVASPIGLSEADVREAVAYAELHAEEIERDIFDDRQARTLAEAGQAWISL